MDQFIGGLYRFIFYAMAGLCLEMIFSAQGIDEVMGYDVKRRKPKKYLEGFVSIFMLPVHGLLYLFLFEPIFSMISNVSIFERFWTWAILITACEWLSGWFFEMVLGFFPWDYYKKSKFRITDKGYSLWTLAPLWGAYGLFLELYSTFLIKNTPGAVEIIKTLI